MVTKPDSSRTVTRTSCNSNHSTSKRNCHSAKLRLCLPPWLRGLCLCKLTTAWLRTTSPKRKTSYFENWTRSLLSFIGLSLLSSKGILPILQPLPLIFTTSSSVRKLHFYSATPKTKAKRTSWMPGKAKWTSPRKISRCKLGFTALVLSSECTPCSKIWRTKARSTLRPSSMLSIGCLAMTNGSPVVKILANAGMTSKLVLLFLFSFGKSSPPSNGRMKLRSMVGQLLPAQAWTKMWDSKSSKTEQCEGLNFIQGFRKVKTPMMRLLSCCMSTSSSSQTPKPKPKPKPQLKLRSSPRRKNELSTATSLAITALFLETRSWGAIPTTRLRSSATGTLGAST